MASSVFLASCGDTEAAVKLNFSGTTDINTIERLNGKAITITGYMATASPLDGSYIYLMNLPYQSCPFCVPNTSKLSNTLAVYAKSGKPFEYTESPIKITGTMELGVFTDDFGYNYNYRIKNAVYEIYTPDKADSEKIALYNSIAQDGLIPELNEVINYIFLLTNWDGLQFTDSNRNIDVYYYPTDVSGIIADSTYGYGKQNAEGYFDSLRERVYAISKTKLEDVISFIDGAEALAKRAKFELENENYTYELYDTANDEYKFTLINGTVLYNEYVRVYGIFNDWFSKFEI